MNLGRCYYEVEDLDNALKTLTEASEKFKELESLEYEAKSKVLIARTLIK